MDIKKRLNKIESVVEVNRKKETPNIFMKNITDLLDESKTFPFRYNKMIQEIIRKATEVKDEHKG